ncbi:glycosyltransferase family 2 protein [Flammeovirga sp. MY04]|uniref:glycosyltransferase family 2 protein n=1 Tax=Flammeovirga sp. MY04 TaxID=1191459 RepID=UPI0008063971|nr:glycosyltransferase family 2 protein [Flammeovirga sp. MY04]ANQ50221.1 glycosyltransferase family 2 protein [Flammeovirga sp. MY04]
MHKTKYSIVIPVYKSTSSLEKIYSEIKNTFSLLENKSFELILVNDSPFHIPTKKFLKKISDYNNVKVIELMKNFGQQAATLCGVHHASGDYIITMDDDFQHHPKDILELMKKENHDVVIAKFKKKKHSVFKRFASNVKGYFDHIILGKPQNIQLSPYRLIKKEVLDHAQKIKTPYPFIPALIFQVTNDIVNIEIDHYNRFEGDSNYNLRKMVTLFSNLLINNSSILLRYVGYFGGLSFVLSIILSILLIVKKIFFGQITPGWTSTSLLILFFGGANLITIGIIGEYLIRLINTTENRPYYYIREIYE